MTWVAEANFPEAWSAVGITSIFKDSGYWCCFISGYNVQKFYKYNLDTNTWTEKADPPAVISKPLSLNPEKTKLCACASNDTHIYIYDIAGDSWFTSAIIPSSYTINSHVWYDTDTIWAQVRHYVGSWNLKFMKYSVSGDSWTEYTNTISPSLTYYPTSCISTDGTVLYAGSNGLSSLKYTIATDTYSLGTSLPSNHYFIHTADRHKLWFGPKSNSPVSHTNITRWLNPDNDALEDQVFSLKTDATKPTNIPAGVYTDSEQNSYIAIAMLSYAAPELFSETLEMPTPPSVGGLNSQLLSFLN